MPKIVTHLKRNAASLELEGGGIYDLSIALRYVDISTMRADMEPAEFEQTMNVIRGINAAIDAKYAR